MTDLSSPQSLPKARPTSTQTSASAHAVPALTSVSTPTTTATTASISTTISTPTPTATATATAATASQSQHLQLLPKRRASVSAATSKSYYSSSSSNSQARSQASSQANSQASSQTTTIAPAIHIPGTALLSSAAASSSSPCSPSPSSSPSDSSLSRTSTTAAHATAPPRRLSPVPRAASARSVSASGVGPQTSASASASASASSSSDRLFSIAASFVSGKPHALSPRASFTSSPGSGPSSSAERPYRHSFIGNFASQNPTSSTTVGASSTKTITKKRPATPPNSLTSKYSGRNLSVASLARSNTIGSLTPEKALRYPSDTTSLKQQKSTSTESLLDSSEQDRGKHSKPIPGSEGSTLTDISHNRNKMHQTSSRLLRMTDDDRPFTKDFKDLFSTLIVSLPLSTHRVRFKSYPFSFTSEEAINNLGSLKFSQSNRMPDPKDPSRIVTTTTTTTFSMAKEMARSVCQRFMDARFIELADGKSIPVFPLKGCLWQLTPKGINIMDRFCQRNGIQQEHVLKLLQSPYNTMRLVTLERDPKTDKLSHDKTTTELIFRRFAGPSPNIKATVSVSDNDSVSDYQDGVTGVKLAEARKIYDKIIKNSFTGKCAVDWLLDCCTTVERTETSEIVGLFLQYGLIQSVLEDKVYIQHNPRSKDFQPTRNAIYVFTDKGKRVAGWTDAERSSLGERNGDGAAPRGSSAVRHREDHSPRDQRETNTTRLTAILNDAALRLLFREFLRETVCEENLAFYLDVVEFHKSFNAIDLNKPDNVRETLAAAYGLYNAFLAPGSPCELNIDHTLRQDMASRMTRAVAKDDQSMYSSLKEVAALFDRAQQQVFKLMAGDSVPKFIRTPRYIEVAGDMLDEDRLHHGVERSQSRRAEGR